MPSILSRTRIVPILIVVGDAVVFEIHTGGERVTDIPTAEKLFPYLLFANKYRPFAAAALLLRLPLPDPHPILHNRIIIIFIYMFIPIY